MNAIEELRKRLNKLHEIKTAPLQHAALDLLSWMENDLNVVHELLDEVAVKLDNELEQQALVYELNRAIEQEEVA